MMDDVGKTKEGALESVPQIAGVCIPWIDTRDNQVS
jgi:hypothetical protein